MKLKTKTSDLTGPALDWAVAKCEYPEQSINTALGFPYLVFGRFNPSTDWAQGGPLIEREGIALHGNPAWCAQYSVAVRAHHGGYRGYFRHVGPTPLIAAMRCYVASKLGAEVEIPEELV